MRTKQWNKKVEAIKDKYKDRIEKLMLDIIKAFNAAGYVTSGPDFYDGDDYSWYVQVLLGGPDQEEPCDTDIGITFQINESTECDGSENGINFSVNVVELGGRIIGGLSPYNYTEHCWVSLDDEDAIEERFQIFEEQDAHDLVVLIERN